MYLREVKISSQLRIPYKCSPAIVLYKLITSCEYRGMQEDGTNFP